MTIPAFADDPMYGLWHPGSETIVSGYGLAVTPGRKHWLVGLLMVDRPHPADPAWLAKVEAQFGDYDLFVMTATGERGIACQMWIEPASRPFIQPITGSISPEIVIVLRRFLEYPPKPRFRLHWDPTLGLWGSLLDDDGRQAPPDLETLLEWFTEDGGAEATDGCWVEADGTCPHGHKSWLLELGLI